MAKWASNSFAQERGVTGEAEHVRVMIGFKQQSVAALQGLNHMGAGMSEVGQNAQTAVTVAAAQLQRFSCIVRDCEGVKCQCAQCNRDAIARDLKLRLWQMPIICLAGQACAFTHPDRQAGFLCETLGMADMVAMLMGDEKAVQVVQV